MTASRRKTIDTPSLIFFATCQRVPDKRTSETSASDNFYQLSEFARMVCELESSDGAPLATCIQWHVSPRDTSGGLVEVASGTSRTSERDLSKHDSLGTTSSFIDRRRPAPDTTSVERHELAE